MKFGPQAGCSKCHNLECVCKDIVCVKHDETKPPDTPALDKIIASLDESHLQSGSRRSADSKNDLLFNALTEIRALLKGKL